MGAPRGARARAGRPDSANHARTHARTHAFMHVLVNACKCVRVVILVRIYDYRSYIIILVRMYDYRVHVLSFSYDYRARLSCGSTPNALLSPIHNPQPYL